MLYDSICMNVQKRQIHRDRKLISVCLEPGSKDLSEKGVTAIFFFSDNNVLKLDVIMIAQPYKCRQKLYILNG